MAVFVCTLSCLYNLMRIELLTIWATPNGVLQAGAITDVSVDLARELVAANHARAIDDVPEVIETACLTPAIETASLRAPRKRGK